MIILLLTAMIASLHAETVLLPNLAPELDFGNNVNNENFAEEPTVSLTNLVEPEPEYGFSELSIAVNAPIPPEIPGRPLYPNDFECWTTWFDRDDPTGTGDWEALSLLHKENPGRICPEPLEIEVQTIYGRNIHETGDVIAVADTVTGFVCRKADQRDRNCEDYRVRFRCPTSFCCNASPLCWTRWFNRDKPNRRGDWEHLDALRKEYKGAICDSPSRIEAVTADAEMIPAELTGQTFYRYDVNSGFICRNWDQRRRRCQDYKVRFECPCEHILVPY